MSVAPDLASAICNASQSNREPPNDVAIASHMAEIFSVIVLMSIASLPRLLRGSLFSHGAEGGETTGRAPALEPSHHHRVLTRDVRAVLFADVVDSVRQMRVDEERTVAHWLDLQEAITRHVLPRLNGRMVKSTGDGLLLDFSSVRQATEAAFAVLELNQELNIGRPDNEKMHLRMGLDSGSMIVGTHDVYGNSVNLAARLMTTLAGPGQIVMSANACDQLTPGLDADVVDLGECYLKSIEVPVRAYCVRPPGEAPAIGRHVPGGPVLPAIAVIPFTPRLSGPEYDILGEILADGMIRKLSRSQSVDVISRLSTTAFRGRATSVAQIGQHLNCNYVLSGTYVANATAVVLDVELSEVRSERIVWSERYRDKLAGIVADETAVIDQVVADIYNAIATQELTRTRTSALATLECFTLLLSALTLMHRRSAHDFIAARQMLETVIERQPRQALPLAWLAQWHVLRIQQGLSDNAGRDRAEALRCTQSALDLEPDNSLALAIDGLVHTHLTKRHDLAAMSYENATRSNPNDALAWLVQGTHYAFTGDGARAVNDTARALKLSPLDPRGYYFQSLSATAQLSAGNNESALHYAELALRSNRLHSSTLRVKAVAQWRLGLEEAARVTGDELLRIEPDLTVSRWLARSPSAGYENGKKFAAVLREIGIPS